MLDTEIRGCVPAMPVSEPAAAKVRCFTGGDNHALAVLRREETHKLADLHEHLWHCPGGGHPLSCSSRIVPALLLQPLLAWQLFFGVLHEKLNDLRSLPHGGGDERRVAVDVLGGDVGPGTDQCLHALDMSVAGGEVQWCLPRGLDAVPLEMQFPRHLGGVGSSPQELPGQRSKPCLARVVQCSVTVVVRLRQVQLGSREERQSQGLVTG
mmetsp:Transcript_28144/g.82395  ORF Transcript_28144/g.82395 Transcript_28144/m.82395 type:complete len:210 (-) Transcript_28144:313-942(-)